MASFNSFPGHWEWSLLAGLFLVGAGVRVFGGGALYYVGWRFLARSKQARYWRSVGAYLLASICGGVVIFLGGFTGVAILGPHLTTPGGSMIPLVLALPLGLLMTWLILKLMCRLSYGKAILAWLPTLATDLLLVLIAGVIGLMVCRDIRANNSLAVCRANLQRIAVASLMYAEDGKMHGGANEPLTPDIATLFKMRMLPSDAAKCPGSPQPDRETDYFAFPRSLYADLSSAVLISCCYSDCHDGPYRYIARLDGSVSLVTPEQFAAELARPENAAFAAALRTAEEKAGGAAPAER
ncbi:MAG: hypothetical protein ACYS8X_03315 [Planctomycetota bacterium]|jgi:hypothetical protein